MQFQITQKVFSLGDSYEILDAYGQPVYAVKSHLLSLGHKLDLLDMTGALVAQIQQRLLSFVPEYDIYREGQLSLVIKKKVFTLFHPKFTVEGSAGTFEMEGDWLNWNYEIIQGGQVVARISKELSLFSDRYGVEIMDGVEIPTILCLVIVMDEVAHPDKE